MTKEDQTGLVHDMCDRIRDEITEKINMGKIPEEWNGHELRQLLADYFSECTSPQMREKKRRRDYENIRAINNI